MGFARLHPACLALAAAVLFPGACHRAVPSPPPIRAVAAQANQHIAVDAQPVRTVIKVESPSGIGSAKVTPTSGAWPAEVVIQLSLKGLEGLRFTYGDTTVSASVAGDGTNEVRESLSTGAGTRTTQQLLPGSPYWIGVTIVSASATAGGRIPLADGYFEVRIPPTLLQGDSRSFTIAWVDFYR